VSRRLGVGALALAVLAACGSGAATEAVRGRVPDNLVPGQLATGPLHLVPYTNEEVARVFRPKGGNSLADDAKVWEVRQADLLVGALEIVALNEKADPADTKDRRSMVGQAIPGEPDRFDVEDVEIYAGRLGSRKLYCWFSNDLLVFLQLRGATLDGERVVADLVRHQVAQRGWDSLPPIEVEEEE
jgi:hypothetical protein